MCEHRLAKTNRSSVGKVINYFCHQKREILFFFHASADVPLLSRCKLQYTADGSINFVLRTFCFPWSSAYAILLSEIFSDSWDLFQYVLCYFSAGKIRRKHLLIRFVRLVWLITGNYIVTFFIISPVGGHLSEMPPSLHAL